MAVVHEITNTSTTFNFLTSPLTPMLGTWGIATGEGDTLITTFRCRCVGSDSTIITAVQALNEINDKIERYWRNTIEYFPWWYRVSATGEPGKQALIYSIYVQPVTINFFAPTLGKGAMFYDVAITHSKYWEYSGSSTAVTPRSTSLLGGTYTFSPILGSYPARLSFWEIWGNTAGLTVDTLWMGIRPYHFGVADFTPLWQCEAGTIGTDTAKAVVAGCSPSGGANNVMQTTFVTTTMAKRFNVSLGQVYGGTNYVHFIGAYSVLLRYNLDAAGTVAVQMKIGFGGANFSQVGERIYLTSTTQVYTELGFIKIPPFDFNVNVTDAPKNLTIELWAEQVTGTPKLNCDCFILVPSEIGGKLTDLNLGNNQLFRMRTSADNKLVVTREASGGAPSDVVPSSYPNWELPFEGGVLVIAGQAAALQTITDTIDLLSLQYLYRSRTHSE